MSPEPAPTAGRRTASAWVAHLRDGGTTPWRDFSGRAAQGAPERTLDSTTREEVPGAAQLELLRRLNVIGRPDAGLAEEVLAASGPGRGLPDLSLVGVGDGSRFGPPPVDPAELAPEELLRVAVGVLAERLASAETPAAAPAAPRPLPWRRKVRLVGDPHLADATRAALRRAGHRPGLRQPRVVLLADELGGLLADVWRWRVTRGVATGWDWWLDSWARRDQLPPRADLTALAAHWAARVGPERVHVVVGPDPASEVARLAGASAPVRASYDGPGPAAVELVRAVNAVLPVLVTPDRHRRLLSERLVPMLADHAGPRRGVPAQHRDWVRERAERMRAELLAAGYPVHGGPDRLAAAPGSGPDHSGEPAPDEVLAVALTALLSFEEASTA